MDDWFIRPLFCLEHLEPKNRVVLCRSIIEYAKSHFKENLNFLRLTKSEFLMTLLDVS
jgi:hypothetical protein